MSDDYLRGRSAWVTGGASGIGRAIALASAHAGADVAIGSLIESASVELASNQKVYLVGEEEMEQTRTEVEECSVRAIALPLDVCSETSVQESYHTIVETFGKIDILVNAAGTMGVHLMIDHPDDLWHRTIDINLNGPYRTIKACFPGMVERKWGRIINVASTAATLGKDDHSAYSASKSGLLGLTRCVALEGGAFGVSCNAVSPGWVATPMGSIRVQEKIEEEGVDMTVEEYRAGIARGYPQKRLVTPEEIAATTVFLCREEAFGITAENITVAAGGVW